jgi:hypothetical protein
VVVENVTASGNVGHGIHAKGAASLIKGSVARGNNDNGVLVTADGSVIENVVIYGNGGDGIGATSGTIIKKVTAFGNNGDGIKATGFGSLVSESNARGNNGYGFFIGSTSSKYRGNVSGANGSVDSCGGGICTSERRFYLTKTTHDGAHALQACPAGFHMAELFEIFDTTTIRYDYVFGVTTADSGFGPPIGVSGWIRTGNYNNATPSNCDIWTSNGGSGPSSVGGAVNLTTTWESAADEASPWNRNSQPCSDLYSVWCVEDD